MSDHLHHAATIQNIAVIAAQARYRNILTDAINHFGLTVQSGPFAGMTLVARASWHDGDMLAKLIGCYERELHEPLISCAAAKPDLVANIGAAEGYYAVGLARMLPGASIHAFDTDEPAQLICREAARVNGVEGRVSVHGHCTPESLQSLLANARRPLVMCECEGGEVELIDPRRAPALASATLIIECHDFMAAGCSQTLIDRLTATHNLSLVIEGARDPNACEFLRCYNSLDRWIAVCEFRPVMMHWLIARPKA